MTVAKRIKCSYQLCFLGKAEQIFPLLCPIREDEWIQGWKDRRELVYSDSGFNEEGCIFKTVAEDGRQIIWHTIIYDPVQHRIVFAKIAPGMMTERMSLALADQEDGTALCNVDFAYTALSSEGNRLVEERALDGPAVLQGMEAAMNHFLLTGTMLQS